MNGTVSPGPKLHAEIIFPPVNILRSFEGVFAGGFRSKEKQVTFMSESELAGVWLSEVALIKAFCEGELCERKERKRVSLYSARIKGLGGSVFPLKERSLEVSCQHKRTAILRTISPTPSFQERVPTFPPETP